uniref:SFRICE_039079 n=1 Tax=Spodoptera frugiperda TaxID=7108 RepID=A0A2H1WQ91_SPOFR
MKFYLFAIVMLMAVVSVVLAAPGVYFLEEPCPFRKRDSAGLCPTDYEEDVIKPFTAHNKSHNCNINNSF